MERLRNVLVEISNMQDVLNVNFGADMMLDCATRIYISENISKERNGKGNFGTSGVEMATEKQISFLKALKYAEDPTKLTKKEAHKLISELTNK